MAKGKNDELRRREFMRGLSVGFLFVVLPMFLNVLLGLAAAILVYIFRKELEEKTRRWS